MNQGFTYRGILGPGDAGRTLLAHLCARHGHSTEAAWRGHIASGRVTLDGVVATEATRLRAGQALAWARPPWEEPEAPLAFAVLHEDEDLLVVAKPSGLPTLPGAQFLEHTLLHLVRLRDPGASPIHRLGRGTSGLVVFARHAAAAHALGVAMREHRITKVYRALVEGQPAADAFTVEVPIGPVPHAVLGSVHAASPDGRSARSHATVLERREGASLLDVRIETGRPHQIRIHLAAWGHPLVGDPLYGPGGVARAGAVPGDLGYLLHAARVGLPHPRTGAFLEIDCAPPPLLRVTRP